MGEDAATKPPGGDARGVQRPDWLPERVGAVDPAREAAKVYQLAFWPDDKGAMPTDFIACAVFAAVQTKNAPYLRGEQIAFVNGYSVSFTGKRLTQVHADVLMGVAGLAREQSQGYIARFRDRSFLRLIGRDTGKSQRDTLRQLLDDLIATAVRVTDPRGIVSFSGSILTKSADGPGEGVSPDSPGEDANMFAVEISRELCKVFARGFGLVDWQQRKALMKQPLALWLQLYFTKFSKPAAVAELHRLCGSATRALFHFRANLRQALTELEEAGAIIAWSIDDADVLHVTRVGKHVPRPAPTVASAAPSQLSLPSCPIVSSEAKATFSKHYPGHDPERCLHDFHLWLTKSGKSARRPDGAFLGFAKSWVKGR